MVIGILKDIKAGEYRVILTPSEVKTLVQDGNEVLLERDAGLKAGFENEEYEKAGANIVATMEDIYNRADLVCKVKEFEEIEYGLLKEGQILFTCIHPAAHPEEVDALLEKKVIAFTAEDSHRYGSPNCEAAGKIGAFFGLESLLSINGGKGKFVSGLTTAPGVQALIIGCGMVGKNALQVLHTMGAWVTVMDINLAALREVERLYDGKVNTQISSKANIEKMLPKVDLVINCVKWPKENKEYMITRQMVKSMSKGSVIVDISNDYGVIETFHETHFDNPRYVEEGVVHYCVSNIPSAIAQSTSIAYAASVLPHIRSLAKDGVNKACIKDGFLRRSLTSYKGYLTHEETSAIQNKPWVKPERVLSIENEDLDPAPRATSTRSKNFIKEEDLKI
ncbi:alanine dehydrogenase [Peptoniphilus catoniae]|uniref:alanine dehydrogenase n=1 Tax=Peptoniphilus catoniae TaxID=1660341 RepID=UPI0010FF0248|nr:alanine dehydrogenase [Peptoniphilus catoniae]